MGCNMADCVKCTASKKGLCNEHYLLQFKLVHHANAKAALSKIGMELVSTVDKCNNTKSIVVTSCKKGHLAEGRVKSVQKWRKCPLC
jgi:hypothetical protein